MKEEFDFLEDSIKRECSGRNVIYLPNPGNWGDALIRHGTLKFFRDINLDIHEIALSEFDEILRKNKRGLFPFFKKKVFIYGGGGGWCKIYNHSTKYVTKLHKKFRVIVLPSSYENSYSIPNTLFFRRDDFDSKLNMPNSLFCHDMAFYIDKDFYNKNTGSGKGFFLRTDKESAGRLPIPPENNDISLKAKHLAEVDDFFAAINEFSEIYTDRLHVAIAGCLLRKRVHVYPGAYFKNRAVFLSSLKNNFDNITFHEEFDL